MFDAYIDEGFKKFLYAMRLSTHCASLSCPCKGVLYAYYRNSQFLIGEAQLDDIIELHAPHVSGGRAQ
jgi:hypothetical protein